MNDDFHIMDSKDFCSQDSTARICPLVLSLTNCTVTFSEAAGALGKFEDGPTGDLMGNQVTMFSPMCL